MKFECALIQDVLTLLGLKDTRVIDLELRVGINKMPEVTITKQVGFEQMGNPAKPRLDRSRFRVAPLESDLDGATDEGP